MLQVVKADLIAIMMVQTVNHGLNVLTLHMQILLTAQTKIVQMKQALLHV